MSFNHPLVRAKVEFFFEQGYRPQGVIHVGANDGEEIPWYLHRNMTPILAFEPEPSSFKQLAARYSDVAECVPAALGSETGEANLWIPRHLHDESDDTKCSSFLRADRSSPYGWGERDKKGRYVKVPVFRFDDWARRHHIFMAEFDTLVIDVQGYELEVLKGFGSFLDDFNFLSVECSAVPIYQGGEPAEEVVCFLDAQGFRQLTKIQSHDDILFVRASL